MGFNENSYSLDGILYFDYLITLERLNHEKQKKASEDLKKESKIFTLHVFCSSMIKMGGINF